MPIKYIDVIFQTQKLQCEASTRRRENCVTFDCARNFEPELSAALFIGAAVARWIRPRNLNREVPGSHLLAAAVVPLGKTLYPHCLVRWKGLKALGPLVACL